jgi:hypothetical protein
LLIRVIEDMILSNAIAFNNVTLRLTAYSGEDIRSANFCELESSLAHSRGNSLYQDGLSSCNFWMPNKQWYAVQNTIGHDAASSKVSSSEICWQRFRLVLHTGPPTRVSETKTRSPTLRSVIFAQIARTMPLKSFEIG